MAEIRALPPTGLRVASLFSGGGGSSLGYAMAGMEVVWASEFVAAARETYRANFPDTHVDERDVRLVQPEDILAATGLKVGELDVLDGSPPCASFSTAGKREKHWGEMKSYSDTKQRTDDLFFEYARILKGLQPRVFVAENVYGLVKGVAKGYFKEIHAALVACGYRVRAKLLDAQWLGVPQCRARVIFVGVREDLGLEPAHPRPLPYQYSIRDALPHVTRQMNNGPFGEEGWHGAHEPSKTIGVGPSSGNGLSPPSVIEAVRWPRSMDAKEHEWKDAAAHPSPTIIADDGAHSSPKSTSGRGFVRVRTEFQVVHDTSGAFSTGDVTDRPSPAVTVGVNSLNATHFKVRERFETLEAERAADVSEFAIGRELARMRPGTASKKFFGLKKPRADRPSPAVTTPAGGLSAASVVHPTETRKFTIAELRRICSFPDDFILTGTYAQQWERCGRAVPPLMMRAVAETLRDEIFAKLPR
jgi:DNA (cytosine-5)-methyltransferase 1